MATAAGIRNATGDRRSVALGFAFMFRVMCLFQEHGVAEASFVYTGNLVECAVSYATQTGSACWHDGVCFVL